MAKIRFRVLSKEGDTALAYDYDKALVVFDELKEQGFTPFEIVDGGKGKRVEVLDPETKDLIFIPRIAGG